MFGSKFIKDDEILDALLNDEVSDIESENDEARAMIHEELDSENDSDMDQYIVEDEIDISTVMNFNVTEITNSDLQHRLDNFRSTNEFTSKSNVLWKNDITYISPQITWYKPPFQQIIDLPRPCLFFEKYFPDEILSLIAYNTNLYAVQNNTARFQNTNITEIKQFFGVHILMGNLNLPRTRMYWDAHMGIPITRDTMTFNRFFKLRQTHLVDVTNKADTTDRFWKVRPLYDHIRKVCFKLPLETDLCIDEQIIPFKGQINVKQYIKNKPNKWGIKVYILAGQSGVIYDFLLYQGSTTELNDVHKSLGITSATVMYLADRISEPNHKLYFDNYFNSFHLLQYLHNKEIYAVGTARKCRFFNPPILSEKEHKKNGRGSCHSVISSDGQVIMTAWYDNKQVLVASNFIGEGNIDSCQRWDKKKGEKISVPRPECISLYNKNMGGVDKVDFLISLYRSSIRSKKWTIRMITHALDMCLINCWLKYKEQASILGISDKNILDLLNFRQEVAQELIYSSAVKKRGRPSEVKPGPSRSIETHPIKQMRFDGTQHFPKYDDKKEATRCKLQNCKAKTHVYCTKCKIHLCFLKDRNCFYEYHQK